MIVGCLGFFCVGFEFVIMISGDLEVIGVFLLEGVKILYKFYGIGKLLVVVCMGYVFIIGVLWFLVCDICIGE